MTRSEPRHGGADLQAIYHTGHTGSFPSPYLTISDLQVLSGRCLAGARVICNVEAFEIDGEFDVPRIDLGFYGESADQKLKSWLDRAADSAARVQQLALDAAQERNRIMFRVRLDWERL